jgi:hypothetical protein
MILQNSFMKIHPLAKKAKPILSVWASTSDGAVTWQYSLLYVGTGRVYFGGKADRKASQQMRVAQKLSNVSPILTDLTHYSLPLKYISVLGLYNGV